MTEKLAQGDNFVRVFFPLELINYVNYFAGNNGISKSSAVRVIMLENYKLKAQLIKDFGKEKHEKLLEKNYIKNTTKRDTNNQNKINSLETKIQELEEQNKRLQNQLESRKLTAETYAKQTEVAQQNAKIKQHKETQKQETIQGLLKEHETEKEDAIQKLIQDEKININAEIWNIEDVRKQLLKLKHHVKEIFVDDLIQDPRVQKAIQEREAEAEKRRKEYEEYHRQEKVKLEKLKQNDYDQWIREYLQKENIKFAETETEIKVLDSDIEMINDNYYNHTNYGEKLEELGFIYENTRNASTDYYRHRKTKKTKTESIALDQ